jgi:putative pyruvate formate lyase activating enzyme
MDQVKIAWYGQHNGEEPPLVPAGGIFFSGCNLHCAFCQNFQISQQGQGHFYSENELVDLMLELQDRGAANIDLVTPTIWTDIIKRALINAKEHGLKIPVMWNSNAYEPVAQLRQLEGLVDIYLPDFKYSQAALGEKYSGVTDYPAVAEAAIREMWRQVGRFASENGRGRRGLIVRHLVLPNNLDNTYDVLETIARISPEIHVSLMNQYEPLYGAHRFPELERRVTPDEFDCAGEYLKAVGLGDGWIQQEGSQDNLIPDFTKKDPFQ